MSFFSLLLAASFSAPALAADAALAKLSGPVSIRPEGAKRFSKAKGGEELIFGDSIRVGKGGVAHIVLPGRGAILLREETVMILQGSSRRTSLSFAFGEFLIGLRQKLEKGHSFKIRTPAAVAAVRGTLFWGKSDKADKSTTYAGFGHTVAVTAAGKTVVLEPGKTVAVAFGQAPAEPAPSEVSLDYAKNFALDGSLQDVETLAEADKLKK